MFFFIPSRSRRRDGAPPLPKPSERSSFRDAFRVPDRNSNKRALCVLSDAAITDADENDDTDASSLASAKRDQSRR
jgi:hypothetical protein